GRSIIGVEDEYFSAPPVHGAPVPAANAPRSGCGHGDGPPGPGDREQPVISAPGGSPGQLDQSLRLGGPGALLAALDRARTGRMSDIVATIQREQDEIIRSPLAGLLMVQGGPGTGKTAVALHRAAYLLYTHRFPLERQGVLVVGPNPLFLRYIERVLPSLGETGVTLSTVSGLVPEIRVHGSEPPDVARLKGEARMARVVARAVRTRQRPLRHDVEVPFGAAALRLTVADSEEIVAQARRRAGAHNVRRRFVEQEVVGRLVEQYGVRTRRRAGASSGPATAVGTERDASALPAPGRDGDPDEVVAGSGTAAFDPVDVARRIRRMPVVGETLDRMWPRLAPHELLHDLFGARPLLAAAGRGILSAAEQSLLHRRRSKSLDAVEWTVADAALVDEARALLGPRRTRTRRRAESRERAERARSEAGFWPAGLAVNPVPVGGGRRSALEEEAVGSFGHIVVDEAQDLSPLQLRMLARRSISGSMTVVGDIAQATGPWAPSGWAEVASHLGPSRPPRVVELTVGYRTPAEVMAVAAPVLAAAAPDLTPPRPVRRSGSLPVAVLAEPGRIAATAAAVAVEEAAAAATGRTAILVPRSLFTPVAGELATLGRTAVDPRDPAGPGLAAPLVVLPAEESHGLEFDTVVVVEPGMIAAGDDPVPGDDPSPNDVLRATARGLRTLYVALTRPTRRLVIVHSRALPAGLEVPPATG
ncbi:MAG: HelD family protein, partial [Acidimicrobiales bacterium]